MSELRTEIALQAPPERIWQLLSDLSLYSEWNPLFVQAEGKVTSGERLELTVQLPAIPPFVIKPKLLCADPHCRLLWRHSFPCAPLMSWSYGIDLEQIDAGRIKLVQRSWFGGLLGPLFTFALRNPVEGGMSEFNRAITRWGEKGKVSCLKC